ncbi:hypothetical protein CLAFUW4_05386 [Fulvia fulva]|uniref:Glycosyl transferase CAP10 domain-containing protein n=1 Tax=Passalora fulva TaxID=5499 RepID=A0A9Q8P978_PASFU|nr:uncharacterized protein CLAFUR5_05534 [Fulvia fulva]KAK4623815.1 hypothetical protein CLAFUR4_05380 [Fulvia fulva]KAK4625081.1 hypothetical protein CLAFUR0_05388 [Fulvia fulva]UJO17984.1 hypothetical protein CLAFUR5_05534 [Fulvia fulva]WPV15210.1 hypothetical protein CLAFUW4_05386 [Fulvia fulva]WPV30461.1 hypothetical protein CLAFUW7_05384 [Fulvia fulva]
MDSLLPWQKESKVPSKKWIYLVVAVLAVGLMVLGMRSGPPLGPASFTGDEESTKTKNKDAGGDARPTTTPLTTKPTNASLPIDLDGFLFDSLSIGQCKEEFPKLFHDIGQRVAYWHGKQHTISSEDTDVSWRNHESKDGGGGAMRLLIHNNELRILQSTKDNMGHMGMRPRSIAVLGLMQRAIDSAIAAGEQLPTIEFATCVEDICNGAPAGSMKSFWAFASKHSDEDHKKRWLMPNYDFWFDHGSGSWKDARRRAIQRDSPFASKIPKIVWRGNTGFNSIRPALLEATAGKDWADMKNVDWSAESQVNRIHQDTYCNYAMTINTEGITYSGRLKYLLNCNSLTFAHDMEWITYWYHLLEAEGEHQNYVQVSRDWHDLEEKVLYYLGHPDEAEKVINNSVSTFRSKYLTRAAESCYTRHLIESYASVAYTPEIYKSEKEGSVSRLRGVPFEQYMSDFKDFNEEDLKDGED